MYYFLGKHVEKKIYLESRGEGIFPLIRMARSKTTLSFNWLLNISVTCALVIFYFNSFAQINNRIQVKRCPVKTINYDQDLMNNSIRGIITDALGFTWVSTSTGMQRYNGYSLQTIKPIIDKDTIQINYPVYFLESKSHSILIGYKNGILEYIPENNSFKKIVSLSNPMSSHFVLMPIKETGEGIWCFEANKGIVIYNRNGIAVSQFPSTETANVADLIRSEDYTITRKLVAANDNFIFIRIAPNKILQINTANHQSKKWDYPGAGIIGLESNNDKIFVASGDGIAFIKIADGAVSKKFLFNQIIEEQVTRSSIELSGDDRLLVSVEKRLFEFDTAGVCLKEIISLNREPLLNTGYIQIAYEDKFRRIWLLTHEDIKRIQNVETPFSQLIYSKEKDNFMRCVYYDKEKNILLGGGFVGLIQLYDSAGKALWDKSLVNEKIKHIIAIEKISDDHYLLMTLGNGLLMFHLKSKQFSSVDLSNFPSLQSAIKDNSYSSNLQRIDDSTIFISTRSNVFRCHIRHNNIVSAFSILEKSQLAGNSLSCFNYSSNKILWVSTSSGAVLRIDPSGILQTINIPENYLVRCMAEDAMHRMWIGTERGLFIYDSLGKFVKHFDRDSGLLNDFIYALLPTDDQGFFASTNFGLSFISKEGKIKNYTRDLGLQENEFNTQSSAMSPSGKLFFGGINGITAFYPSALAVVRDSSLINITRLVVNDSLYNSFGSAWKGDSIALAYNQNHLQFDIAATGLLDPNEYLYRYRLKNFEEAWQTTNQPTNIRYTLNPGTYLLEIICSPTLFSNTLFHKNITIIINEPWWKTWWFIIGAICIASALIFFISYYIIWQRYQLKLEKLEVKQQLTSERERISRELHDNIGSQLSYISSNIDWLVEAPESFSKEEESKRLSIVNDTAKNLVTDLRETIWAMKKESIGLDELADKMKSFLQSQCILQPQIEMTITEEIRKKYSFSPTEALNVFRICQEAIVNSIRHAQARKIFFNIQSNTNEDFSFTVEDNGKGFVREKQYKDHYGLENMMHRAAEVGADLLISSEPGKGTKVTITKHTQSN